MKTIVDAIGRPPPEPFEMTMEALADLASGATLTLLVERVPFPLFRLLERDGYTYEYVQRDDGIVEVTIVAPAAPNRQE